MIKEFHNITSIEGLTKLSPLYFKLLKRAFWMARNEKFEPSKVVNFNKSYKFDYVFGLVELDNKFYKKVPSFYLKEIELIKRKSYMRFMFCNYIFLKAERI